MKFLSFRRVLIAVCLFGAYIAGVLTTIIFVSDIVDSHRETEYGVKAFSEQVDALIELDMGYEDRAINYLESVAISNIKNMSAFSDSNGSRSALDNAVQNSTRKFCDYYKARSAKSSWRPGQTTELQRRCENLGYNGKN